ncbi:uncharacterized protein A4U43_C08F7200 [Asparagus officinalis]|nr:uncharacterized protein A4U43_C08F7200 [Asparagus officinalis]
MRTLGDLQAKVINPQIKMSSSAQKKVQKKRPVIIYLVPPTVIHAEASEFMALVQRLTGKSASGGSTSEAGVDHASRPRCLEFPVRVKARLALRRQQDGSGSRSFFSPRDQDAPMLASDESNWLFDIGDQNHEVGPHHFIDIFQ